MLRYRIDRMLDRLHHRRLAWPLVVAATIFGCTAAVRGDEDPDAPRSEPRSHIQVASEMVPQRPTNAAVMDSMASPFGLVVSRVPDLLREHLELGYGVGLVVNDVVPKSPAAVAGFKQHDVLVSIDEQSLIVPEQLVVLLAGEGTVAPKSCAMIRNGRRQTISIAEALPATAASPAPPPAKPKQSLTPPASALAMLPTGKKDRELATRPTTKNMSGIVRRTSPTSLLQEDSDYSLALSCDDEKLLAVHDIRGRTVFRAVIETPEQRSRIPLAVRDRVEHLERLLDRQMQATARPRPAAEIGRLDIEPVQVK